MPHPKPIVRAAKRIKSVYFSYSPSQYSCHAQFQRDILPQAKLQETFIYLNPCGADPVHRRDAFYGKTRRIPSMDGKIYFVIFVSIDGIRLIWLDSSFTVKTEKKCFVWDYCKTKYTSAPQGLSVLIFACIYFRELKKNRISRVLIFANDRRLKISRV